MKVKVKLDMTSIKAWFFEHGEKLAFGLTLLAFVAFVVSAAHREVLDETKSPEKLKSVADDVTAFVASSKWDPKPYTVIDYDNRATRDHLPPRSFSFATALNGPLADPKLRRDDPKLFNVEELRVAAGYGAFALRPDGSTSAPGAASGKSEAKRGEPSNSGGKPGSRQSPVGQCPTDWSGLRGHHRPGADGKGEPGVRSVFERVLGGQRDSDFPYYAGHKLERTEVNDAEPDKLDWKPVPSPKKVEAEWERVGQEIVAAEFADPNPQITGLLGPLVGEWGESAAHPKIPLANASASEPQAAANAPAAPAEETPVAKPAEEGSELVAQPKANTTPTARSAPTTRRDPAAVAAPDHSLSLIRAFDYTVEPNKKYRYRVKLALANPNFEVPSRFLKNPDAEQPEFRWVDEWSAPTDVVTVPAGSGVLAGAGVKTVRGGEPSAKLMLTAIDKEGIEAAVEVNVQRGTVANAEKDVTAIDPRTGSPIPMKNMVFKTDMVVLDFYGGKSLCASARKTRSPRRSTCCC